MLTLLSILTGGGLIGSIVLLVLRPALRASLGGALAAIPARVWGALALIALVLALTWYHGHAVKAARAEGRRAGVSETNAAWDKAQAEWQRAAAQWTRNIERRDRSIADEERQKHDQAVRDNRARADALRLLGPGRSAAHCIRPEPAAGVPPAAGGPEGAPTGPDAPEPELPAGNGTPDRQWAIVPWGWLVDRAREHDDLRAENVGWRRWYLREQAAWDKARADGPAGPKPEFGDKSP
ncbi:hypothetical protein B0I00_1911 [Novosphingobium kunmingense]|uniref:Uncharacterized protein n=1 Tax=Novosphingobium kunmingense TaxID=1211806 RepID=A0A2N0HL35_9SPHN|nr:hypothetical protein [Novosphingobium kunmingense]PKB19671.1 hypothetical protein B0I00_1911 [Novosphingobium kunmingense]